MVSRLTSGAALAVCLTSHGLAFAGEPSSQATSNEAAAPAAEAADAAKAWCAPELEAAASDACVHLPASFAEGKRRTLLVFLHGVVLDGSGWQWAQQRGALRVAKRHGYALVAPKGRLGIGGKTWVNHVTWPTSRAAQTACEKDVLGEWQTARAALEKKAGKPFERVYVFGFSNGAYYATSLAMRGAFAAHGFAAFAGGSGAPHLKASGKGAASRAPFFLGYASDDKSAAKDATALAKMLRELKWPFRAERAKKGGHAMLDAHVAKAIAFFDKR